MRSKEKLVADKWNIGLLSLAILGNTLSGVVVVVASIIAFASALNNFNRKINDWRSNVVWLMTLGEIKTSLHDFIT